MLVAVVGVVVAVVVVELLAVVVVILALTGVAVAVVVVSVVKVAVAAQVEVCRPQRSSNTTVHSSKHGERHQINYSSYSTKQYGPHALQIVKQCRNSLCEELR
jgi:type IV secretory pathway VirB3-like protein